MIRSVAITGATGFIGRHVAAALVTRGVGVTAIVRPHSTNAPPPGATVIRSSLDEGPLREAFAGADAVVHLAGVVSAVDRHTFSMVNVEGTRAVAAAARAAGSRLIHISSLAAGGPAPASAPRCEDDPSRPVTPYGVSKLKSERLVQNTVGLRALILRPGVVYGPTDRAVLPLFQAAARGVLPLVGRADTAYTFVYIDDVVRTIVAAIEKVDVTGTIFVGHSQPVTARDLLDAIQAAMPRRARIIPIPLGVTRAAAIVCDVVGRVLQKPMPLNTWRYAELAAEGFVCRVDRLRDELGIVAETGLSEGIAKTAAWYREAGWLMP